MVLGSLFVLVAFEAARGFGQWELDVFRAVYGDSDRWRTLALIVTQLGSAWFWIGLAALFFIIRRRPTPALLVLRNGAVAYAAVTIIKFLVDRPRPEQLFEGITARELITLGAGFPSAHVTIATVMSLTVVSLLTGKKRWVIPVLWVSLVAWSRLYLGVHAPLDVLGGVLLGVLIMLTVGFLPQGGMWRLKSLKKHKR